MYGPVMPARCSAVRSSFAMCTLVRGMGPGSPESRAGTIIAAGTRPFGDLRLHLRPRWRPVSQSGIENDCGRAAPGVVEIQAEAVDGNEFAGLGINGIRGRAGAGRARRSRICMACFLKNALYTPADLASPLFSIGPGRYWRLMGIEQGQCLLSILLCEILLAVCQISVGKIRMRVGGIGIREEIQLEDLNGILDVASALEILADDVTGDLGPQLRLRIFPPGFQQLLRDPARLAGHLQLVQD